MPITDKSSYPKDSSRVCATPTDKNMSPHTQRGCLTHTNPQLSLLQVPLKVSSKFQHFSCYRFSTMLIHEVAFAEVTDISTELPSAQLSFLKTATVTFFIWRFYSLDTKLEFLETGHLETCTCQLAKCWNGVLWSHHKNCSKKAGSTVIHSQRLSWKNNSVIFQ